MTVTPTTVFNLMQNQGLAAGFVVMSRAGHDMGRVYIVLRVEGCFAWLVDGDYRAMTHPKRKRISHVRPLGSLDDPDWQNQIATLTDAGRQNAALRQLIATFIKRQSPTVETPCSGSGPLSD